MTLGEIMSLLRWRRMFKRWNGRAGTTTLARAASSSSASDTGAGGVASSVPPPRRLSRDSVDVSSIGESAGKVAGRAADDVRLARDSASNIMARASASSTMKLRGNKPTRPSCSGHRTMPSCCCCCCCCCRRCSSSSCCTSCWIEYARMRPVHQPESLDSSTNTRSP